MRWVIWTLLVISTAVGLALLMRFNHGNVAILWPPYRVDVSVNFAVLVIIVLFLLMHLLLLALGKAFDLPARVRDYQSRRQAESARMALRDSLLALFEGRFGRAERLAQAARDDDRLAGPAALIAARAAHRMRETERRDRWLALAEGDRASTYAELMTSAEMALEEHDPARAIEAIERLHSRGLRHIQSLRVALRAFEQSEDWPRALQVLRQLEKRDALHPAAVRGLRVRALRALLARSTGDSGTLRHLWADLRPAERALPEVVEAAASAFAQSGEQDQARRILEAALDVELSARLLALYASLDGVSTRERLQQAERWRNQHGDDPELSLALGRLCMAESLWGKAEEFLTLSLAGAESGAAHLALAELCERLDRPADAARHFRASARLAGNTDRVSAAPA